AEPPLHLLDAEPLAARVVLDLVAIDPADAEVLGGGVGEVQAADAGAWPHGERLGDADAGALLDLEQAPEGGFFGVVGAGGVAGGGADAAVLFGDEVVVAERFVLAVAPLDAGALVEALGEGFGEAVGEGFGHDGVVVVVLRLELEDEVLQADAAGDGKGADVVCEPAVLRSDEVGEAAVGTAALLRLLA